jgi:hypothetical protein
MMRFAPPPRQRAWAAPAAPKNSKRHAVVARNPRLSRFGRARNRVTIPTAFDIGIRSPRALPAAVVLASLSFVLFAFANRNETKHLPYGEGTLRAEPLRAALKRFKRPATVISESPGDESHQTIKAILFGKGRANAQQDAIRGSKRRSPA